LSSISTINSTLTSLQSQINTINTTITTIQSDITTLFSDITNITTVLLPAVYTYIDDAITNITNNFIAGGVIDMNDNRIINLPCDPEEDDDAISFCFLWHTLHDEVTVSWS
jgi:phage-related minor tail protein